MDVASFRLLDEILKDEGYRLKTAHPFFIPGDDGICKIDGLEIRKYNQQEILQFKGDGRSQCRQSSFLADRNQCR